MRTLHITIIGLALAFSGTLACSSDDGAGGGGASSSPQCESNSYVAFDSANHASQDVRVATHTKLNALLSGAATDLASSDTAAAAKKFADAKTLYTDPVASASLQEKVQGRLDEHVAGNPLQGDRMDATIVKWLDFGAKAQTELEATVAKQWVDKTLTEFFFLSVHHELLLGEREKWDEAFGYFGSGANNQESGLQGLASTAFKRDATNGTSLESTIYNALIDGSCELDQALTAAGSTSIDVKSSAKLLSTVDTIDVSMQKVLAYSAGHEAFEMRELLEASPRDDAEITVKAAELIPFFIPLERIMQDKGGESAQRASSIRAAIDAMPVSDPASIDLTSTAWIDALGTAPDTIIKALEAEYGIVIKG